MICKDSGIEKKLFPLKKQDNGSQLPLFVTNMLKPLNSMAIEETSVKSCLKWYPAEDYCLRV